MSPVTCPAGWQDATREGAGPSGKICGQGVPALLPLPPSCLSLHAPPGAGAGGCPRLPAAAWGLWAAEWVQELPVWQAVIGTWMPMHVAPMVGAQWLLLGNRVVLWSRSQTSDQILSHQLLKGAHAPNPHLRATCMGQPGSRPPTGTRSPVWPRVL